jgi:nucleoside-diphosphate-sugar epimerase
MKLLVFGAAGMLGHRLCQVLVNRFEICGTLHGDPLGYQHHQSLLPEHVIGKVDARDFDSVRLAIDKSQPEAVVNCIGIVKQRDEAKQAVPSVLVNALFPHQLLNYASKTTLVGFRFPRTASSQDFAATTPKLTFRTQGICMASLSCSANSCECAFGTIVAYLSVCYLLHASFYPH